MYGQVLLTKQVFAKETLKQVYEEKVTPAIDKWNNETKYQLS